MEMYAYACDSYRKESVHTFACIPLYVQAGPLQMRGIPALLTLVQVSSWCWTSKSLVGGKAPRELPASTAGEVEGTKRIKFLLPQSHKVLKIFNTTNATLKRLPEAKSDNFNQK